jgi:hypothetical protein
MQAVMSQAASSNMVDPLLLKRNGLRWNFILPSLPACDFSGKGAVGCGRFCPNFITGEAGPETAQILPPDFSHARGPSPFTRFCPFAPFALLPHSDIYAYKLDTPFHELGHNLGLMHSSTPTNEYGDSSCVM